MWEHGLSLTINGFGTLLLILGYFAQPYYKGRCLFLGQLDMSCFVTTHGLPAFSWIKTEEEGIGVSSRGRQVGGGTEKGGYRESCK